MDIPPEFLAHPDAAAPAPATAPPGYGEAAKRATALYLSLVSRFRGLEMWERTLLNASHEDRAICTFMWNPWYGARTNPDGSQTPVDQLGAFAYRLPTDDADRWRLLPDKENLAMMALLLRNAPAMEAACARRRDEVRDLLLVATPIVEELLASGGPPARTRW